MIYQVAILGIHFGCACGGVGKLLFKSLSI